MYDIIPREKIQVSETTYRFQGSEHGGVSVSFFWMLTLPDQGPVLHLHPYEEVFVMEQGQATFTIGEATLDVNDGQIVVVPANTPHKFKNTGYEPLQMLSIHPSKQVIQKNLE